MTTTGGSGRDRDITTRIGLAVVGIAAAVLSFSALSDLAARCGVTGVFEVNGWTLRLAWLVPITVDVFAAVSTRVWLRGGAAPDVIVSARRSAWGAIGATVVGNAYHGYLTGFGRPDAVIIGAVPAVALGRLVHLAVLRGRPTGEVQAMGPGRVTRWRATGLAWWETRKAMLKASADRRATSGETGRTQRPDRSASNEELAADLRRLNSARQADGDGPLVRDAVAREYRIGSGRAETVRKLAEQPTGPTAPPVRPHVVRDEEEAAG